MERGWPPELGRQGNTGRRGGHGQRGMEEERWTESEKGEDREAAEEEGRWERGTGKRRSTPTETDRDREKKAEADFPRFLPSLSPPAPLCLWSLPSPLSSRVLYLILSYLSRLLSLPHCACLTPIPLSAFPGWEEPWGLCWGRCQAPLSTWGRTRNQGPPSLSF